MFKNKDNKETWQNWREVENIWTEKNINKQADKYIAYSDIFVM